MKLGKVATVIGARPQFVKAATVSRAMRLNGINELLIHTGQHFDFEMSEVFFRELEIPKPKYNLGIGGGSHGQNTGRMIEAIERVLMDERPDLVLVYGDTDSTLAGAVAAAKLQIPIAHVEAGLRSFNRSMPEEINRVLTDHASDILFAPTEAAMANLKREGISGERVHLVGDVMYDAAIYYGEKAQRESRILENIGLSSGGYVLATVHRSENVDDANRLDKILSTLAGLHQEIPVVFPVHPRTWKAIHKYDLEHHLANMLAIKPVGYLDMVMLEKNARFIVTDSGGVQKEAFFFRVPCITIREETEWVELVDMGWNRIIPPEKLSVGKLLGVEVGKSHGTELYGGGMAAIRIVSVLNSLQPFSGNDDQK